MIDKLVKQPKFSEFIDLMLICNAIILGLLTFPEVRDGIWGASLEFADTFILAIFVVELLLRMIAYGKEFFNDGWNIFDGSVIAISLLAYGSGLEVLRTFRVLRLLRLISSNTTLRRIIDACIASFPGIFGVIVLFFISIFIYAVMACNFFAEASPETFGNLFCSMYSIIKIALFFDWGIAEAVGAKENLYVFVFFISYFLLETFIIMNMIISIVFEAYDSWRNDAEPTETEDETGDAELVEKVAVLEEKLDKVLMMLQSEEHKSKSST